jgi:hypothetical protein
MRPNPEMIPVLIDAARALKGSRKRVFMAKTVQAMGRGGQRWSQENLGRCRETIRKGTHELRSGMTCVDAFHCRRRKPAEAGIVVAERHGFGVPNHVAHRILDDR